MSSIKNNTTSLQEVLNTINELPENISSCNKKEDATYAGCYYYETTDGVEWINPPMIVGVEYRTTEKFNGNPVYVTVVDYGSLPNTKEGSNNTLSANLNIISMSGFAVGSSYNIPIPGYYAIQNIGYTRSSGNLWIATTIDLSSYHGYVTVKYTK